MKTDEFFAVPSARSLSDSTSEFDVQSGTLTSRLPIVILGVVLIGICGFLWQEISTARSDLMKSELFMSATELVPIETQRYPIFDLSISPLGDVLFYRNLRGQVIRQDLVNSSNDEIEQVLFPEKSCDLLEISPISNMVAVATREGEILARDLDESASEFQLLKPRQYIVESMTFSPDCRLLAAALAEGRVFIFDLERKKLVSVIRSQNDEVSGVLFDSPLSLLISLEGRLEHWTFKAPRRGVEMKQRPLLRLQPAKDWELAHAPIREMVLSADGSHLYATTFHRGLTCVDLKTQEIVWAESTQLPCARSLQLSRDGACLVAHAEQDVISLRSTATGEPVGWLSDDGMGTGTGARFSLDGNLLYTTSTDGYIRIWSVAGQTLIGMVETRNF